MQWNESIILVRIDTKPKDTDNANICMPTTNEENDEVEKVYDEYSKLIENIKGDENLILLGD